MDKEKQLTPAASVRIGQRAEREAIAAWLRRGAEENPLLRLLADGIDAGEHHKPSPSPLACDPKLAIEAWQWLSGTHAMIKRGGTYSAAERVAKAETCLSSACEWERDHADDAKHWVSDELGGAP